jgi:hypothetical protein
MDYYYRIGGKRNNISTVIGSAPTKELALRTRREAKEYGYTKTYIRKIYW